MKNRPSNKLFTAKYIFLKISTYWGFFEYFLQVRSNSFYLKYFDFFEKICKNFKKITCKKCFQIWFQNWWGKIRKNWLKNEIIVIVYDRRSFMSDWRSYFWEFKMNDRGSYFYNIRAHDREWSWLMIKMIVPITDFRTFWRTIYQSCYWIEWGLAL